MKNIGINVQTDLVVWQIRVRGLVVPGNELQFKTQCDITGHGHQLRKHLSFSPQITPRVRDFVVFSGKNRAIQLLITSFRSLSLKRS